MAGNQGLHSAENGKLGGRPRLEATKLRAAIVAEAEARAERLAKVLADKAESGDVPALKEIFDRGLGKAHQTMEMDVGERNPGPVDPRLAELARKYDEEARKLLETNQDQV